MSEGQRQASVGYGIYKVAEAAAFMALLAACVVMEVHPADVDGAGGLWVVVVTGAILGL